MYYRKALELQAFLDMAKDEGTYLLKNKSEIEPLCNLFLLLSDFTFLL